MPITPSLLAETERGSSTSSLADTSDDHNKNIQSLKLKLLIKQLRRSRVITVGVVFILTCLISAGMIEIYLRCLFKDGVITLNHQSLQNSIQNAERGGGYGNADGNGNEDGEESVWESETDTELAPVNCTPLSLRTPSGIKIWKYLSQRIRISVVPELAVNPLEHTTTDEITSPAIISLADQEDSENEITSTDISDPQGTQVDSMYEPCGSVVGAISGHQITEVDSIYESKGIELDEIYESKGTELDDFADSQGTAVFAKPKVAVTVVSRAVDFGVLTAVGPLKQHTTTCEITGPATNLSADPLSEHEQEAAENKARVSLAKIEDFDVEDSENAIDIPGHQPATVYQSSVFDAISENQNTEVDDTFDL